MFSLRARGSARREASLYLLVRHEPRASITGADVKFSLAMSSMPLLRERERTGTNDRGTERTRKRVSARRGFGPGRRALRDEGLGGRGRVGARARGFLREARRAGRERAGRPGAIDRGIDRGQSRRIVSSPPTDAPATLVARCLGREGAGAIDAGAGRGRGARATTHIWRSFSFCTRAYTSGSASLRGLRASGKTASCAGRGRAGWGGGGGIRGRRTTVSRDERRQPRSRARRW